MIVNIPTKYWIFITILTGCLSVTVLAGVIGFIYQDDINRELETLLDDDGDDLAATAALPSPTVVPAGSGPVIDLTALPTQAELDEVVPLRVRVSDDLTGLATVQVLINGRVFQAPQLLEGQQQAQVNFGYIPGELSFVTIEVIAVATDGRQSRETDLIEVIEAAPDSPDEIPGFDLIIAANDDPFDLALEFGVCPTRLVELNPALSTIQPGDSFFVPTNGVNLEPTTYDECADIGQDTIQVINFFENTTLGIRRASLDVPFPISLRFSITPGRDFECASFPTGAEAGAFGCPAEKPFFHTGIDIGAPKGTELYSVTAGEVIYAGTYADFIFPRTEAPCLFSGSEPPHEGYGNMMIIESVVDGRRVQFLYAHMTENLQFETGDIIEETGIVIGYVGSTGCSTAPHLHFEVLENNVRINPTEFLDDESEVLATE